MIRYYVAPGLKYKDGLNVRMDSGKSIIEKMERITDVQTDANLSTLVMIIESRL